MMSSSSSSFLLMPITPISITDEMRQSYLGYAMSVIVSRALPDVRDGLKPVHRRILYAMKEGGYDSSKLHKKSARIVGDVMGKFHPHGDTAIYDAIVRMGQDFSMRLPLIDGQGNFGSMDGDPPAAMRYTEARLSKIAESMLDDIDKNTVDFQPNYDETTKEPTILPARFPNLLVNGSSGIAVGMATNIPPHNLGEVIDACCAYIDNPEITIQELISYLPGPDFPTRAMILDRPDIHTIYHLGKGSVVMRARTTIEELDKDRQAIIVTEIPYQINKSKLIEHIATLVNKKTIEGISDLRDESTLEGVRIVITLKRGAVDQVVLNQLFHHSALQTTFSAQILALNNGRPELMTLKNIIAAFVSFRENVLTRKIEFDLNKALERAQIFIGLAVAVLNLDSIISLIRQAPDPHTARSRLLSRSWDVTSMQSLISLVEESSQHRMKEDGTYHLHDIQAQAILDLRLHRLTGLERSKISNELTVLSQRIKEMTNILSNRDNLLKLLRIDLQEIKERFNTPRYTEIIEDILPSDEEELIQREDMVVTVSNSGYIKRVLLSTYRAQRHGGKGQTGMPMKAEDTVSHLLIANTHTSLLLFSSRGTVYKLKVHQLPAGERQARGKALVNLLPLSKEESITALLAIPEDQTQCDTLDVMFATSAGHVRRNRLSDFKNIRSNGKIAMKLDTQKNERVIAVQTCPTQDDVPYNDVLLATSNGLCIRFPVTDVRRISSRDSKGVRGIKLTNHDKVISMSILSHVEVSSQERETYLHQRREQLRQLGLPLNHLSETKKQASLRRQRVSLQEAKPSLLQGRDNSDLSTIKDPQQRFKFLASHEEFILTVSQQGDGQYSSAYEYRIAKRGGQGRWNMNRDQGPIIMSFSVLPSQQVMLITSRGKVIRIPVVDISITRLRTKGIRLFKITKNEYVVKVDIVQDDIP